MIEPSKKAKVQGVCIVHFRCVVLVDPSNSLICWHAHVSRLVEDGDHGLPSETSVPEDFRADTLVMFELSGYHPQMAGFWWLLKETTG